jgi:hypothetical protein
MGSLLRTAKKHKKSRRLGKPEVMAREEYGELEVDVKIEMIRSLIPLGLMHVHELLDDEVKELAGERYARKGKLERGRRHGTNPGTVGLAGQRVPIRVPRVRSQEGVEIPLRSYEALNDGGEVNDLLLKRVLYGISCRNYEAAAEAIPGAIGLSSSTVSRGFVQASAAKLREMQERDLSGEECGGAVPGREIIRRRNDGHRAGHHTFRGKTLFGLRGDGHGEREGVDAVPAFTARAGTRQLPGSTGDHRWRQGSESGRKEGVPKAGPDTTVPVAQT